MLVRLSRSTDDYSHVSSGFKCHVEELIPLDLGDATYILHNTGNSRNSSLRFWVLYATLQQPGYLFLLCFWTAPCSLKLMSLGASWVILAVSWLPRRSTFSAECSQDIQEAPRTSRTTPQAPNVIDLGIAFGNFWRFFKAYCFLFCFCVVSFLVYLLGFLYTMIRMIMSAWLSIYQWSCGYGFVLCFSSSPTCTKSNTNHSNVIS